MFDKNLWRRSYVLDEIPHFPCPKCLIGRILFEDKPISKNEPVFSERAHSHDAWEPDWVELRIALKGTCNLPECGETVHAVGRGFYSDLVLDDGDWVLAEHVNIHSMCPSPPVIQIPSQCPDNIVSDLLVSFKLIWVDYSACATRLRLSVERLLDAIGIPKSGKTKKGKLRDLNLAERIDAFSDKDPDAAEVLHALRHVGNVATHEGTQSLSNLLDCFEIYEEALRQLVGDKSAKLEAIRKRLIESKGK
jgi:hypothetical protein